MAGYQKSDYALNKYGKGIVYRFADGTFELTEQAYIEWKTGKPVTPEEIQSGQYEFWQEEFARFKALSDEEFLRQARGDNREAKRCTSWESMTNTFSDPEASLEEAYERKIEYIEKWARIEQAMKNLSEKQRRRAYLYFIQGMTTRQIAKYEGVKQSNVWKSISNFQKKIFKNLKKWGVKPPEKIH